jgi:hypothetical protein
VNDPFIEPHYAVSLAFQHGPRRVPGNHSALRRDVTGKLLTTSSS